MEYRDEMIAISDCIYKMFYCEMNNENAIIISNYKSPQLYENNEKHDFVFLIHCSFMIGTH